MSLVLWYFISKGRLSRESLIKLQYPNTKYAPFHTYNFVPHHQYWWSPQALLALGQVVHNWGCLDHLFVQGLIVKFKMKSYTLKKLVLVWALAFVNKLREERQTKKEVRFFSFFSIGYCKILLMKCCSFHIMNLSIKINTKQG